jgi:hypothetical protein
MRQSTRIAVFAANVLLIILGTAVPVLSLLAFLLDAVCLFRFSKADSFSLLLFLMPFAVVFKITVGMPSLFQFLVLVAAGIFAFRRGRFSAVHLTVLLLFVGYIAAGAFNSVGMLIKFAGGFALLYFFTEEDESDNAPLYTYSLTAGFLVSSFVAWFGANFSGIAKYVEVFMPYRINNMDAPRFTALYGDPNYYTVGVILSISLLLLLYTRNKLKTAPFLLLIAPLIFFGFKTGSKSFLLLLGLLCLAFFFILVKRGNYWVVWFAGVLFVGGVVFLLSKENNPLQIILDRLIQQEEGDITTGRTAIWGQYAEYLLGNVRSLLFGEGLGAPIPESTTNVPHSTYIDCIYYLGIVGTAIASVLVFMFLRRNPQKERPDFANWIAPVMLILLYAFLSELYYGEIPFHLMLVLVGFRYARPRSEEKGENTLPPPAFIPAEKKDGALFNPLFSPLKKQ